MDGIIVFSKHDDVIYIHSNDIFKEHIHKKAKENGLTDVSSVRTDYNWWNMTN